jgi:hypothetical protein
MNAGMLLLLRRISLSGFLSLLVMSQTAAQQAEPRPPAAEKPAEPDSKSADAKKRLELNLLGQIDTAAGESRRNENIQFNLVDNNALKELNVRLGTTATIVREFSPGSNYFGAEFGNPPVVALSVPSALRAGRHGNVYVGHLNSIFTARSFFQVGDVKPARENDYGFTFSSPLGKRATVLFEGSQQRLRGSVNGNVLVPAADERTALATDPATRATVERYLEAYPAELPNRTDVNRRALNRNAPQVIDNNHAGVRLDQGISIRDRVSWQYFFTSQSVTAFQLVAGQNPETDTKSHKARLVWSRQWSAVSVTDVSAGFDRLGSLLRPEPNAVGPMVSTSGLETLGPQGSIPIDRAHNMFRYAGQLRSVQGRHSWSTGFAILRRQINGFESDAHRGFFSFSNDFGRDAITNLRLGAPTQYIISTGNVHRGFRSWDTHFYAGDNWKVSSDLSLQYGLRYQPGSRPVEVNDLNQIPYDSDRNNFAPQFGFAYRLPQPWGVMRAAYGLHFGEIFPVTFQQVRFSPPGSVKIVVTAPNLVDPLGSLTQEGEVPNPRGNLYLLDPELATPYSHQYNLSWEPEWSRSWKLQLGYVGSRSHKLFVMWYTNRAHPVPGIEQTTATINLRRANENYAEIRWVLNGSRGYFDAGRVSLVVPRWRGLSLDASYWLSKAIDLGSSYTNTAADLDSRLSRSQFEYETHRDMKGPSPFDQTHAFLWRSSYALPFSGRPGWGSKVVGGWNISAVVLVKTGIPFNVASGSDGPGYGNVDGNGGDRPNSVDPSILGRTVGDPDTSRLLLPRSAFVFMQPLDERGNLGRNVFRKGGIRNVNAACSRTWVIARERNLTFRAESINLFNTPQFAEPGFELANPNFGQITNTLNDGRTFRFAMQLSW